jgi:hypothetical protein
MAIVTPTGGTLNPAVVGTTMLFIGAQTQPVATTATNNRKRPKGKSYEMGSTNIAGFTPMDNLILTLDAQYDLLPNKTPWVDYALTITGDWQLCANCQPESSGKKLFRQYNFNRTLLNLPVVNAPIDPTAWCDPRGMTIHWFINFLGSITTMTVSNPNGPGDVWCFIQNNKQRANPQYDWLASTLPTQNPGSPFYVWWAALIPAFIPLPPANSSTSGQIPMCVSGTDGQPGVRYSMTVDITHGP